MKRRKKETNDKLKMKKKNTLLRIALTHNLLTCAVYQKLSKVVPEGKKQSKSNRMLMEEIIDNVEEFKDLDFFPKDSTLISLIKNNTERVKIMAWYRLHSVFQNEKYHLFNELKINSQTMNNKAFAYIVDAMNTLSTQPGLVMRLFEKNKICREGVYAIWLNINGLWKQYLIDDFVPIFKDHEENTQFFFSAPSLDQKEIWFCLLEKALAKAYNGYDKLSDGFENYVVRDFTGAPCSIYDIPPIRRNRPMTERQVASMNIFWGKIYAFLKKGYLMSAAPRLVNELNASQIHGVDQSSERPLNNGINSDHNFAVVTIKEVEDAQGQQAKIVKLRNPWLNQGWHGDWSNKSSLWTEGLREQLNYFPERYGTSDFWMSIKDFMSHFECINIYKAVPGFVYSSVVVNFGSNLRIGRNVVRVSVLERGKYTFSVDQKDLRSPDSLAQSYSSIKVTFGKLEENGIRLLSHTSSNNLRNTYIRKLIDKGEYYLLIEKFDKDQKTIKFVDSSEKNKMILSSYGPRSCGFAIIEQTDKNQVLFNYIGYHGWKGYARRKECKKISDFEVNFYDGSWNTLSLYLLKIHDSNIYVFRNENPFGLKLNCQIAGISNMEILGPEGRINYEQDFLINPGGIDIFILREAENFIESNQREDFQINSLVGKKYKGKKDHKHVMARVQEYLLGIKIVRKESEFEEDDEYMEAIGIYDMENGGRKIRSHDDEVEEEEEQSSSNDQQKEYEEIVEMMKEAREKANSNDSYENKVEAYKKDVKI